MRNIKLIAFWVCIFMMLSTFDVFAEEVVLKFWTIGSRAQQDLLNQIFTEFSKANPGIKVQLMVAASWEDLYQKVLVSVAGGAPPDIIRSKDFWVPEFASRDVIEDLTSWVEKDKSADIKPEKFWPIRWQQSCYKGRLYSLPWTTFTELFFYNKDLFAKVGLNPGKPPDTWKQLREYAIKLTDEKNKQWGTILYTYSRVGPAMTEYWELLLMQAGGSLMNKDESAFTFYSPAGIEALQHQLDMLYKDRSMMPPEFASLTQPVERGKIGMWYLGPWGFVDYPTQFPDLKWGVALMPQNKTRSAYSVGNNLVMLKGSKHKEEAWKLLKWLMKPENDYKWNTLGGYLPSQKINFGKSPYNSDPNWLVQRKQFLRSDTMSRPYPLGFNEIHTKFATWLQKAYLGQVGAEEALKSAQAEANALLKEFSK